MSGDHISTPVLERYAAGETGSPSDLWWAVEAHLESCVECRDRLAEAVSRHSPATAALLERVRVDLAGRLPRTATAPARHRRVPGWARAWRLAVDGLDLALDKGVHGLLGPNGAGQTTLMLVLDARQFPSLLSPLLLAIAAWQARRDRRSRMDELLATTTRPRWQRVLPAAGALAIGVVAGALAVFAVQIGAVVATVQRGRPAGAARGAAMRLLALYLRSRWVPAALAAAVGLVAALWWLDQASDHQAGGSLALLAVVAATVAAGPGLAGPDVHLDRTAAIGWPPRRILHLLAAGGIVAGLVVATALTGEWPAPAGQITRDAAGMVGLLALGAALLSASRAWIPPVTWTLIALTGLSQLWPPSPDAATYQRMLTWMLQPAESTAAGWTAAGLAAAGSLAYAIIGPRPTSL